MLKPSFCSFGAVNIPILLPIIFALITFCASRTLSLEREPLHTPEASEALASQR